VYLIAGTDETSWVQSLDRTEDVHVVPKGLGTYLRMTECLANDRGCVLFALYAGRSRRRTFARPAAGDLSALSLKVCSSDDVCGAGEVSPAASLTAEDSYNVS